MKSENEDLKAKIDAIVNQKLEGIKKEVKF